MQLYWIRHGESDIELPTTTTLDDINALFDQRIDFALSPRGRGQAAQVARHFADQPPVDAVYASDLRRAQQTAAASAAALDLEVRTDTGIGELRTGVLSEQSWAGTVMRRIEWLPARSRRKVLESTMVAGYLGAWWAGKTDNGESPEQFRARLAAFYDRLLDEMQPDAKVAVFAHGYLIFLASMAAARRRQRAKLLLRPYVPNGSITSMSLQAGPDPRLQRYAAAEHLKR